MSALSEVILSGGQELADWRAKNSFAVPGAEYMALVRSGRWDGVWKPGKWLRRRSESTWELACSRGLAMQVSQALGYTPLPPAASLEALHAFTTQHPRFTDPPFPLREYQSKAVTTMLYKGWGRVAFATNAGKGAVMALMATYGVLHAEPVLVCCDEVAVFDALVGEFRTWTGRDVVTVTRGIKDPPQSGLVLAMVPTLAKRLEAEQDDDEPWREWMAQRSMLLLDEADKAQAPRWRTVLQAAKNSKWRVGFSGSFPTDPYEDLRLTDLMGPIVDRIRNKEMVAQGVSAKPLIELHRFDATPALYPLPAVKEYWAWRGPERRLHAFERAIVYNAERHKKVAALIRPETRTAIVVNRIDHGKELAAAIPGSVFIDGSTSESNRITTLESFRTGKFFVLITSKILDRGTNRLGWADDVIFASGEGSQRQTLQRIGRGLRRAGGKEALRLVDLVDSVTLREEDEDQRLESMAGFLHGSAKRRIRVYSDEGFDVRIATA